MGFARIDVLGRVVPVCASDLGPAFGGASKVGILVKGSNYLEALSKVDTVVFDKTGTLTSGTFEVTDVVPSGTFTKGEILEFAAHAEALSNHPIALSIQRAYEGRLDMKRVAQGEEISGHGAKAEVDGKIVLAGNDKLMYMHGIDYETADLVGTQVHVAVDGHYVGSVLIGDTVKADSAQAIVDLHNVGVKKTVMLTGDRKEVAEAVADSLGVDEVRSELLPEDKVDAVEKLLGAKETNGASGGLAFVGDGINDAPVLMRADVGIAMGAMGSDAAIEAADIVLMDDRPTQIASAIRVSKKTMRIVWQNIIFALGVKFAVLVLAAFGVANMWMAVFADVGVAVIAILNAMRALRINSKN